MVYVGIDVAKDKHDCFIVNSDGEVLYDVFTIQNDMDGFEDLLFKIKTAEQNPDKVKVGLEATGHYGYNLLGFLLDKGLTSFVINPLHTNLYRKSLSLRKTKTNKVDAYTIASMIMSDVNLKSYSNTRLTNLLSENSKGRYGKDTAFMFRETAKNSIGSHMSAKSLELKHTIKLIHELDTRIE